MATSKIQENQYAKIDYPSEGYLYDKLHCKFAKVDKDQLELAGGLGVLANYLNRLEWQPDTKISNPYEHRQN
jgi:hypothetical protein